MLVTSSRLARWQVGGASGRMLRPLASAISTGDIFRANVAVKTPSGLAAHRYMEAGDYVPRRGDNAKVRDRIGLPDAEPGFFLDGFPRTLAGRSARQDAR